ncbi:MAG: hypothetical protein J6D09_08055 [Clostridia bacterium]|nr:hypothetical protein [Clostridia bacterium]
MKGKKLSLFIDSLYLNPEMEFEYEDKRYLVSGYRDDSNEYILQVDTIEVESKQVFYFKDASIQKCVEALEKATLFDGRTVYEAHNEITVLYG